jgi:hypothetical protein
VLDLPLQRGCAWRHAPQHALSVHWASQGLQVPSLQWGALQGAGKLVKQWKLQKQRIWGHVDVRLRRTGADLSPRGLQSCQPCGARSRGLREARRGRGRSVRIFASLLWPQYTRFRPQHALGIGGGRKGDDAGVGDDEERGRDGADDDDAMMIMMMTITMMMH